MSAPPTHLVVLAVGGRRVHLRTNSAAFARVAADAFVDLVGPVPTGEPPVVFEISWHDGSDEGWAIHRDGQPCELSLRTDHVLFHLQWELNRLVIEHHPASVHAAAVVAWGGAVVLAGASHAGKTTLGGWLALQHDLEPLADEVVVLDEQGRAMPYHRPLGVRADSPLTAAVVRHGAALVAPAGASPPVHVVGSDERLVPMRWVSTRLRQRPVEVSAIVFPQRDLHVTAPTIDLLTAPEALVRLAAGTPGLHRQRSVVFPRLAMVARRAVAIEMRYAEVADGAPALLDALTALGCVERRLVGSPRRSGQ